MRVFGLIFGLLPIFRELSALTSTMNSNIQSILGPSDIQMNCSYLPDQGDELLLIRFKAFRQGAFKFIANFAPLDAFPPSLTPDGQYLVARASLTNPTIDTNTSTLTFSRIECEDETDYECEITFVDGTTSLVRTVSYSTNLTVNVAAETPDTAPSISVVSGIEEGQNVTFTCLGNIGNPPGTYRWEKYRIIGFFPTVYPDEPTTVTGIPDSCTYNGTSSLTISMEDGDHNSFIRCVVIQEVSTSELFQQTGLINVFFSARQARIIRIPDQPSYTEGSASITLQCAAVGNPPPMFSWYKEDENTLLSNTSSLVIYNVTVNSAGNYTCITENSFNGKTFNTTVTTQIIVGSYTTPPQATSSTPAATTTQNPQPSTTVTVDDHKSDNAQDNIPAIVGGSVGGLVAIVGVFIIYKYTCGNTVKYQGESHGQGQITHFDKPIEASNPPRSTSYHLDLYNSIQMSESTGSKL